MQLKIIWSYNNLNIFGTELDYKAPSGMWNIVLISLHKVNPVNKYRVKEHPQDVHRHCCLSIYIFQT